MKRRENKTKTRYFHEMTQTEMEGFVTYLRLVYVEKKFKFIVVFTIFNPYPISLTSASGVNNKLRKVRMRHVCCPVSTMVMVASIPSLGPNLSWKDNVLSQQFTHFTKLVQNSLFNRVPILKLDEWMRIQLCNSSLQNWLFSIN